MSDSARQNVGTALGIIGTLVGGIGGTVVAVFGTAISYHAAREKAKDAEAEALRKQREAKASRSLKSNFTGGAEVHNLVFGEVRVGGLLAVREHPNPTSTIDVDTLYLGVEHSICHAGGCEGITGVWINDTHIPLAKIAGDIYTNGAAYAYVNDPAYQFGVVNSVQLRHHRGTGTQAADSELVSSSIEANTAYRRGISWTSFKLARPSSQYDEAFMTAFSSGIPTLGVTLRGIKLYDPRLDSTNGGSGPHRYDDPLTWTWSRNTALAVVTYMIMERSDGGMGRGPTSIDWPSVAAAANICDEVQTIKTGTYSRTGTTVTVTMTAHGLRVGDYLTLDFTTGGGTDGTYYVATVPDANTFTVTDSVSGSTSGNVSWTERRYSFDGALLTSDSMEVNLRFLLDAMLGECIPVDGKNKIYAGAYRSPTFTLDESWLRDTITVKTRAPLENLYNRVRVIHDDRLQNYQHVEARAYTNAAYETEDGGEQLWREETLEGVTSPYQAQRIAEILGRRSRAQRVIEVPCTLKALDVECWETGTVTIAELGLSAAVHRVVDWGWDGQGPVLILQQEDSSYYTAPTYADPVTAAPANISYATPPIPDGVAAARGVDGIDVTWSGPQPERVKQIDVYRSFNGSSFSLVASVVGYRFHDPVTAPGSYQYKLKSRSSEGNTSDFSATVTVQAEALAGGNLLNNSFFANYASSNQPHGYVELNDAAIATSYLRPAGRRSGTFGFGLRADANGASTFGLRTNNSTAAAGVTGGVQGAWSPNKTYVVSWHARKVNGSSMTGMSLAWSTAPTTETALLNPNLTTSYQRYARKLEWGGSVESDGQLRATVGGTVVTNDEVHVCDVMVTEGEGLSEWSAREEEYLPLGGAGGNGRVQFDGNGIRAFDSSGTQRVNIAVDGSGWMGSSSAFSWTSGGVVSMAAANVSGTLTGNTIQTSSGNPKILLDSTNGLQAINSVGTTVGKIATDGSGYLGGSAGAAGISWDNLGNVTFGGLAQTGRFYSFMDRKTSGTAQTVTIPTGARILVIRAWGGGGSGNSDNTVGNRAGGGGGAGVKKTVIIRESDWGGVITYTVGPGGAGVSGGASNGNPGTASTVTSTGLTFADLNLSAGGGGGATVATGGSGGAASGGDTNTSGNAGVVNTGGNSATIDGIFGVGGGASVTLRTPGGGSRGAGAAGSADGAAGEIHFIWS